MEGNVTPFLIEKWEQAFYFFDTNKDGMITREDYVRMADYISEKAAATEEEAVKSRQEWLKWYHFAVTDSNKKLDLETFVGCEKRLRTEDRSFHLEETRAFAKDMFERINLNKNGKISLDELNVFYEAVGVCDKAVVQTVFQQLDKNKDGFLQRQELEDDFVRHFTNPDPEDGRAYLISSVIDFIR